MSDEWNSDSTTQIRVIFMCCFALKSSVSFINKDDGVFIGICIEAILFIIYFDM